MDGSIPVGYFWYKSHTRSAAAFPAFSKVEGPSVPGFEFNWRNVMSAIV